MWLLPTAHPPPCWQRRTDGTAQKDALNPDDPPEKSGRATPESWRHGRSSLQGSLLPRKKATSLKKNTTAIGGSQDRTKTLGILLVFQQSQFLAPQRAIPMCGNWQLRALAPTEQKPTKIGHLAGQNGPRRCNRSERGPLLHGWSACCTLAALHESTLCSRNMRPLAGSNDRPCKLVWAKEGDIQLRSVQFSPSPDTNGRRHAKSPGSDRRMVQTPPSPCVAPART